MIRLYFCPKCYKVFAERDFINRFGDSRDCLECNRKTIILNQKLIEDIIILYNKEPIGSLKYSFLQKKASGKYLDINEI